MRYNLAMNETNHDSKTDKFSSIAKQIGCDESDDALDKAFENLDVKVEKEEESTDEEQDQ